MVPLEKKHLLFVVDDRQREEIYYTIKLGFPNHQAKMVSDFEEASAFLKTHTTDLVFAQPKIKNTSLFKWVTSQRNTNFHWVVVEQTGDHIAHSFQYGAAGYLKMPFQEEHLERTFKYLNKKKCQQLKIRTNRTKEISIKPIEFNQVTNIQNPLSEIMMITADGDYAIAHLNNASKEKIPLGITLKKATNLLAHHGFFRVHHQCLVNTWFVKNEGELYQESGTGKRYLRLLNNQKIEVARRRRTRFKKFMELQSFVEIGSL